MPEQVTDATPPLLLFDGDCGFCSRVAGWLASHMRRATAVPLQRVELARWGVDPGRAAVEVPFVTAGGIPVYGDAAIAAALLDCGGPLAVAGRVLRLAPVRLLARVVYAQVARHRHRLPGGTAACRL